MISENLPQGSVWENFYHISAVPHVSGHEEQLALRLVKWAEKNGFNARMDGAGNVIISRHPAPGFENAPKVILQGHLDMVPQSSDPDRDMTTTPVEILSDGKFLHTGGKTTLGADNAIGVAVAMTALSESPVKGELRAVFTRNEEVGMDGAFGIEPESLNCNYLINLDTGSEASIYVGCAGGGSVTAHCRPETVENTLPCWNLTIAGLKGGHSGIDIAAGYGNAIILLAELLRQLPDSAVAAIQGGTLSNVIPSSASAVICSGGDREIIDAAQRMTGEWRKILAPHGDNIHVSVAPAPSVSRAWSTKQKQKLLDLIAELPLEVVEFDDKWNIPALSGNLAKIAGDADNLDILVSLRAQDDAKKHTAQLETFNSFVKYGFTAQLKEGYAGWKPAENSILLAEAITAYRQIYGHEPQVKVIHAGAECGLFARKQPELEMISCGPDIFNFHSVNEKVDIASVERIQKFVFALLEKIYS